MAPRSTTVSPSCSHTFLDRWPGLFRRQLLSGILGALRGNSNSNGDEDEDEDDQGSSKNSGNGNGKNTSSNNSGSGSSSSIPSSSSSSSNSGSSSSSSNSGSSSSSNNSGSSSSSSSNSGSSSSSNNSGSSSSSSSSSSGNSSSSSSNSGNGNSNKNSNSSNDNSNTSGQSSSSGSSNNGNGATSSNQSDGSSDDTSGNSNGNSTQSSVQCASCFIPDNDPRVVYEGQWSIVLSSNSRFTKHQTTTPGSSVQLQFNGTSITVFGTVPRSNTTLVPPTASYTIDAEQPFITTQPTASQNIGLQRLFFVKDLSPDEEHTITIKVIDTGAPYTLQSFFIPPSTPSNSSTVNETVPPSLPPPLNGTAIDGIPMPTTTDDTPSKTGLSTPALKSSPQWNTVKILAATLGVVLAVVLILLGLFLWRRKRQSRSQYMRRDSKYSTSSSDDTASSSFRASQFTSSESILRSIPSVYMPYTSQDIRRGSIVDYYLPFHIDGRHSPVPPVPPKP